MHILVCGGAGYVGSHTVSLLAKRGHQVTVLDNLSTGHREAVRWGRLIEADLLVPSSLSGAFDKPVDAVMHFCARSLVGESVAGFYPAGFGLTQEANDLLFGKALLQVQSPSR